MYTLIASILNICSVVCTFTITHFEWRNTVTISMPPAWLTLLNLWYNYMKTENRLNMKRKQIMSIKFWGGIFFLIVWWLLYSRNTIACLISTFFIPDFFHSALTSQWQCIWCTWRCVWRTVGSHGHGSGGSPTWSAWLSLPSLGSICASEANCRPFQLVAAVLELHDSLLIPAYMIVLPQRNLSLCHDTTSEGILVACDSLARRRQWRL